MARQDKPDKPKRRSPLHWMFPLGIAAAGLGSFAAILLRGCWHTKMGWPIRVPASEGGHHEPLNYSYQVCTRCGAMRLFDEKTFRGYGPFGYDIHDLIARDRAERIKRLRKEQDGKDSPQTNAQARR